MTQPPTQHPVFIPAPAHGTEIFRTPGDGYVPEATDSAFFARAKQYFINRKSGVLVDSATKVDDEESDSEVLAFASYIDIDAAHGIRIRGGAVRDLDTAKAESLAKFLPVATERMVSQAKLDVMRPGQIIKWDAMAVAPSFLVYTNELMSPVEEVVQAFASQNVLVHLIDETELLRTAFISYGNPDVSTVRTINKYLKSKGVRTWFFPEDAIPGQKLHRVMSDAVNSYDRVLLMCSKNSLVRPGVLNELERVLEREAREGGSDILIPVALDDFVYGDWAPQRKDLADQVRSRVVATVDPKTVGKAIKKVEHVHLDRLVNALTQPKLAAL